MPSAKRLRHEILECIRRNQWWPDPKVHLPNRCAATVCDPNHCTNRLNMLQPFDQNSIATGEKIMSNATVWGPNGCILPGALANATVWGPNGCICLGPRPVQPFGPQTIALFCSRRCNRLGPKRLHSSLPQTTCNRLGPKRLHLSWPQICNRLGPKRLHKL